MWSHYFMCSPALFVLLGYYSTFWMCKPQVGIVFMYAVHASTDPIGVLTSYTLNRVYKPKLGEM